MNVDSVEDVNRDGPTAKINAIDMEEDAITNVEMSLQLQIINHGQQELQRRQHMGVVVLLCYVAHALHLLQLLSTRLPTRVEYANVVEVLRSNIDPSMTKQHIKNRQKTLKENFGLAYDLFHSLSGFAWNPLTKKFEAKEGVWEDLIKVKKHIPDN
ncbi:hypothetical protein RIF29_15764 [Crotalaria pallida]|uniref:Myb/SANT-like domain-containing protein n=1 Tax=Crotalaria pallida TaxID=3830 RepID=A0AAN9FE72_CROPI